MNLQEALAISLVNLSIPSYTYSRRSMAEMRVISQAGALVAAEAAAAIARQREANRLEAITVLPEEPASAANAVASMARDRPAPTLSEASAVDPTAYQANPVGRPVRLHRLGADEIALAVANTD